MQKFISSLMPDKADEEEQKNMLTDGLSLGVHFTKDDRVRISVRPPTLAQNLKRLPVVLCCVVDVSGSMQVEAVVKDANGKSESDGISVLGVVKHSIKTIIHCLDKNDYLSIVSYSDKAQVVTDLTKMDKKGKKTTLEKLNDLRAEGQTNLWDGLHNGLEVLRKKKTVQCSKQNSAVLLFTDGLPNVVPPNGHLAMLEKYIEQHQELHAVVNTYGFGYSLDSKLLTELAIKGQGTYSFIPDSSFVGTIFVHSISNLCCNLSKNTLLKVKTDPNYDVQVLGGYEHVITSWGVQLNLGNITYGQSKDVVLQFVSKAANVVAENDAEQKEGQNDADGNDDGDMLRKCSVDKHSLNYMSLKEQRMVSEAVAVDELASDGDELTEAHYYRLMACDVLRQCMDCLQTKAEKDAQAKLKQLIQTIDDNEKLKGNEFIKGLLADLSGQAFEAISSEYFDKWGKHYLPSLIFAHLHQYNNNFKDPGVQHYGGALFKKLSNDANEMFIKLAPPEPEKVDLSAFGVWAQEHGQPAQAQRASPANMSNYYNVGGGCLHGGCNVLMADGTLKAVRQLMVNDVVDGGASILCVVKHECEAQKVELCDVNGLWITPYHPIRSDQNGWIFPCEVDGVELRMFECEFVYNFVLSHGHVLNVNGTECCTLGHGMNDNKVIEHAYFGTDKVVEDLRKWSGWNMGMIVLRKDAFKRNVNSQLVEGLVQ